VAVTANGGLDVEDLRCALSGKERRTPLGTMLEGEYWPDPDEARQEGF
jgi:hypothetical protein